MAVIEVDSLSVEFPSGDYLVRPLEQFSVKVPSGSLALLVGPSGCGKTTLLSCLGGILTPSSGSIRVGDTEVTALAGDALTEYRRHGVGIVFQSFNLIDSLTAAQNVAAPLTLSGMGRRPALARANELLDLVGLADRARHRPHQMSGGQQQRVAIARALAHDPPLLLADEPSAHLDHVQVEQVLSLLRELASPGRTVVVTTHDERFRPFGDVVIDLSSQPDEVLGPERRLLEAGEIVFRQGDPGERVYVVEEGRVEIYRERVDGAHEHVAMVRHGEYFGELAPMLGIRRSASARAVEGAVVTGYGLQAFRERMRSDGGLRRADPVMSFPERGLEL